jgi:hypothetical protein
VSISADWLAVINGERKTVFVGPTLAAVCRSAPDAHDVAAFPQGLHVLANCGFRKCAVPGEAGDTRPHIVAVRPRIHGENVTDVPSPRRQVRRNEGALPAESADIHPAPGLARPTAPRKASGYDSGTLRNGSGVLSVALVRALLLLSVPGGSTTFPPGTVLVFMRHDLASRVPVQRGNPGHRSREQTQGAVAYAGEALGDRIRTC